MQLLAAAKEKREMTFGDAGGLRDGPKGDAVESLRGRDLQCDVDDTRACAVAANATTVEGVFVRRFSE